MNKIRTETNDDHKAIATVNAAAFGRAAEGDLVAALRRAGALALSLVAEVKGQVVGHIAFSPGRVVGEEFELEALALGPMAVLPEYQNQGVGSRLVRAGLGQTAARASEDWRFEIDDGGPPQAAGGQDAGRPIFVLGHAGYYPRFGFVPAQVYGLRCEFDVAPQYFMVWAPAGSPAGQALSDVQGRGGTFYYRPEFRGV